MPKAARFDDGTRKPKNWPKQVSAAYLRMIGHTQDQTAEAVGVSLRTIQAWESNQNGGMIERARAEASSLWLNDTIEASRRTVFKSIERGNADIGLKIIERTDRRLAPPSQRLEHTGADGAPLPPAQINIKMVPTEPDDAA